MDRNGIPKRNNFSGQYQSREIDIVASSVHGWWGRALVAIQRTRVKTWQGVFLLAFVTGVFSGLIWVVSLDIETESDAKINHPTKLLEVMRTRGCIADGILSGYGGDVSATTALLNRSECRYYHRALETWLNPPDFDLARRIKKNLDRSGVVYGMFISEALNTEATYYASTVNRVLKFSDMCQPGSVGFWGKDTCKSSFASEEYRIYLRDITRKAMDLGIQGFLFGQIAFQDANRKNPVAPAILEEMRAYAREKHMLIAIGAQTNTISNGAYLELFDYIEGGVGIDQDGNVDEKPCASRYEKQGWCWALLWNKKYSSHANMVLLHLDWSGIDGDDMSVFAKMDRDDRAKALVKLDEKFNGPNKKTGFLFPFLAVVYDKNGGCYGAKKNFYSPDNRYSCKDEDAMNVLLRKSPVVPEEALTVSSNALNAPETLPDDSRAKEEKNDAEFSSQDVPEVMLAGQSYVVSVTMKNIGTTVWTDEAKYRLGSQNPQDNGLWGGRVFLSPGEPIEPKEKLTFRTTVTAPIDPGIYDFQWRMLREGQEWFGEKTKNIEVTVVASSEELPAVEGESESDQ